MLLFAFSTTLVVSALVCQSADAQVTCDDQFTGADSNAWGDPGNWSAGLPTSSTNACWSGITVVVSSGDQVVGTIGASDGGLVLSGGSLDVSSGLSEPLGSLSITGGSLTALGGFDPVSGDLSWTGGTITGAVGGSAASTTDIGGTAPLTLAGAFGTDGSMTITNPNLTLQQPPADTGLASPGLSVGGTLTFGPGVTVSSGDVEAQYSVGSIAANAGPTYGFDGLFQLVLTGGGTTTVAAGSTLGSGTEGEIELEDASPNTETLDIDGTVNGEVSAPYPDEDEKIEGSGTINGDLRVSGEDVVEPGDPVGTLTVTGMYVQSNGFLIFDIAGATDGDYSQLVADQGASFEAAPASGEFYGSATTLKVNPEDGFTPTVSDSFTAVASPPGVGFVDDLVNFADPQLVPIAFGDESEYGIFTSADSETLTLKALPVIPADDQTNFPVITGASGGDGTTSTDGLAYVGDTLTCDPGTWDFDPTSFTYTWSDFQYASGQTQVVTAAQVGSTVDCNVTATNANGTGSVATSQFVRIAALPPAAGPTTTTTVPAVSIVGAGTVLVDGVALVGCPGACSSRIAASPVILTATPAAGWAFAGWTGICTGTGTCTIPGGATSGTATATFTLLPTVSVATKQPSKPVISRVTLNSASVTFRFAKPADGTHLQCALVRHLTGKHARQPKPTYSSCGVTKTYSHLQPGRYALYVRSVLNGRKSTAIERAFTIA
jgi:hypothetical protein